VITQGFIKSIQDIMRKDRGIGTGDVVRQLDQLIWMIFLKAFDDIEKQKKFIDSSYSQVVPDKYRWSTWAAAEDGITGDKLLDFINNDLMPSLRDLPAKSDNAIIRIAFEESHNYMKDGTLLRQVVNKINTINFNSSDDRHTFNDLYETLLSSLQSAGDAGEYYTPRAVTKFVTEMVAPKLGESVLDPACGTGGFLSSAIDILHAQAKTPEDMTLVEESIHGIEKMQLPYSLCIVNMMLHGIENPINVRYDNTLSKPLISYGPKDYVDTIVANPPFGGQEVDGIEKNFPSSFRTRETADLFLVLMIRLLKDGGRAGIVLPDGTLFGEGVKTRIKEHLLQECNLHTVVRLPKSVFAPYTSIATNLLFFTKGTPTKEVWYYEHKLREGVKAYNKTKPIRSEEFELLKAWWNDRKETDQAWKVSIDEIKKRGYNLDIKNPNVVEVNELDPEEVLTSYRTKQVEVKEILEKIKTELTEALAHHDR
jgi:type I restriction enzyme M protein